WRHSELMIPFSDPVYHRSLTFSSGPSMRWGAGCFNLHAKRRNGCDLLDHFSVSGHRKRNASVHTLHDSIRVLTYKKNNFFTKNGLYMIAPGDATYQSACDPIDRDGNGTRT